MRADEIRETFRYHSPSPEAVLRHEGIRRVMTDAAVEIAGAIPHSRERSTFITLMQQAQMMAKAAIAIHGLPDVDGAGKGDRFGADHAPSVQLEQGLASGELRGEERRSVIENLLDAEEAQDGD